MGETKTIGELAAELLEAIDRKREARRRKLGEPPGSFVREGQGSGGKVAEFVPGEMEKAPAPNGRRHGR